MRMFEDQPYQQHKVQKGGESRYTDIWKSKRVNHDYCILNNFLFADKPYRQLR